MVAMSRNEQTIQASESCCGTEFPGFCLLTLSYTDGLLEAGFCFRVIVRRLLQQEHAFEPIQL
jgi:hypothetical protein